MKARRTAAVLTLLLSALPPVRLFAQGDLDRLALRFASMTAVTGLEQAMVDSLRALFPGSTRDHVRSEEHTSELQSLAYLVCRLLLEKKKKRTQIIECA